MHHRSLAADYIKRAQARIRAISVLMDAESWPDVVRESQEVVELALKALLRSASIETPRIHDLTPVLKAERERLPEGIDDDTIDRWAAASRRLRRDRELAFYGTEDLIPGEFYTREDAERAQQSAVWVVATVSKWVPPVH